jgi:NHL repeat-containing protein
MNKAIEKRGRRAWLGAVCAAALALGAGAAPSQGAPSDPLFVFTPTPPPSPPPFPIPPPSGDFAGPCGLAVASNGDLYVSDYYHHAVDVFTSSLNYEGQIAGEDPLDGPCALALDSTGKLYVNNFHRNVVRFAASPSFGAGTVIAGAPLDSSRPTGVAVDPTTNNVYVDERTHVAVYGPTGALVEVIGPGAPGSLGNGYGLAFSRFPATLGRLYVPDAADNTVKVYQPALDTENPIAAIDGPGAGFVSLRDSAVAVDRVSGDVYVADAVGPQFTERPETTIDVFDSTGAYEGRLKYNVIDAGSVGLAVDNSTATTQGRVYVTSGNTDQASVYAYPPGAATSIGFPAVFSLAAATGESGAGQVASEPAGIECSIACAAGAHPTAPPVTAVTASAAMPARARSRSPHHAKHRHRAGHRQPKRGIR